MYRHEINYESIKTEYEHDEALRVLETQQEKRYAFRKMQEANFWIDKPEGFLKIKESGGIYMSAQELKELTDQHKYFASTDCIEQLNSLLTDRNTYNEEVIQNLTHPDYVNQAWLKDRSNAK